jgi:hypothetical protein
VAFEDRTALLASNTPCRSYGVTIFDVDGDGRPEILVNAADTPNLILKLEADGLFHDVAPPAFAAPLASSLCTAVGDFLGTGAPCLYTLNTEAFAGPKRQRDSLFVRRSGACDPLHFADLSHLDTSRGNPHAGRSVVACDLDGDGRHHFYVPGYGGPAKLFEFNTERGRVVETAVKRGLAGPGSEGDAGRARGVVAAPLVSERSLDLLCTMDEGPHRLFARTRGGRYRDVAADVGIDSPVLDGRGVATCDLQGDGRLSLVVCHWDAKTSILAQTSPARFEDRTPPFLRSSAKYRNVVVADFDNDGFDEVFLNSWDGPNRMIRYLGHDGWEDVDLGGCAFELFQGTGSAVGDLDGDGLLECYVSNGEKEGQVNLLFGARQAGFGWLRVLPLTRAGFPALGARVRLELSRDGRRGPQRWARTRVVCGGSGYLSQMEPVAHFGIGGDAVVEAVDIMWPGDGHTASRVRLERPVQRNTTLVVPPPAQGATRP